MRDKTYMIGIRVQGRRQKKYIWLDNSWCPPSGYRHLGTDPGPQICAKTNNQASKQANKQMWA